MGESPFSSILPRYRENSASLHGLDDDGVAIPNDAKRLSIASYDLSSRGMILWLFEAHIGHIESARISAIAAKCIIFMTTPYILLAKKAI